jgi:UDP:flavonoid glycosyltransferase YjiC (YdhE family)
MIAEVVFTVNILQVTVISPFPMENPPQNYTPIDISDMKKLFEGTANTVLTREIMQMNLITKFKFLYRNTLMMTNFTLQHPEMKKLLNSSQKFDLIILDLFLTDALLGLSTVYDCPVVALSANGPHTWVNDVLGSPRPASYVPHMYTDFNTRMNLGKRLENEFFYFVEKMLMKIYHLPPQEELFNQVFPNSKMSFDEVRRNSVAIALVNSHFSISFPKPFLPNTIEVAGMQINEAVLKPLPEDIREFIENSEHGVIYFSLGGNVKVSQMDEEKKQDLIKAFSSLKQNVIWKYDGETLDVDPKKIMVRKWLPQYEILGHSNTKLFITHAGLLSVTEAIHFAKPVIAIPIFGDQPQNAKKCANERYGIHLDYFNFTGVSVTWAVNEILSNPM